MRRVRIKDDALEQQDVLPALAGRDPHRRPDRAPARGSVAFWLQVVQHDHYLELSLGNRARIEPLPPNRGIIFDRAGRVIAENTPAYQLELVREQAGDLEETLSHLVSFGLLDPGDDRPRATACAVAALVRGRALPAAAQRRRDCALRRAPPRAAGRPARDPHGAPLSVRHDRRARTRLCRNDRRGGPGPRRPRGSTSAPA